MVQTNNQNTNIANGIEDIVKNAVKSQLTFFKNSFIKEIYEIVGESVREEMDEVVEELTNDIIPTAMDEVMDERLGEFADEVHTSIHDHFDKFDELIDQEVLEDMIVDTVEEKYRDFFNALRKLRARFRLAHPELAKKGIKLNNTSFDAPKKNHEDPVSKVPGGICGDKDECNCDDDDDQLPGLKKGVLKVGGKKIPVLVSNRPPPGHPLATKDGKPVKDGPLPDKFDEEKLQKRNNKDKYLTQILELKTSQSNKEAIYERYMSYVSQTDGKEKHNDKKWLEKALKLPFDKIVPPVVNHNSSSAEVRNLVSSMFEKLNQNVYGMNHVKEEIVVEVVKRLMNPDVKGKIIVLEGPPGIGKTLIAHNVASSIGLPFDSIALGGCRDADILKGHEPIWVGSHEGRIARSLQKMGVGNGLLYLDEIDKIGDTPKGQEVAYALLSILDETQNYCFNDNYFTDISMNLSRLFIIGSVNDRNKINPILADRMKFITLEAPSFDDKVEMVKKFFVPMYNKEFGMSQDDFELDEESVKYLVKHSGGEKGVRDLKRDTEHIISRINFLKRTRENETDIEDASPPPTKSKRRKTKTEQEEDDNSSSQETNTNPLNLSFSLSNFEMPLKITPQDIEVLKGNYAKKETNEHVNRMYL